MDWFTLSILTAAIWGIIPFFEKHAVAAVDNGFAAVAIRNIGAAIGIFLPLVSASARAALPTVPLKAVLFLIFAGFIGSVVGQLTYLTAMRLGEVSRVTPVAATWPVVTLVVALAFMGEPISLKKILAVGFIVGGVLLLKA
ncbi:MAG: EamA family transporter [Candidatus Melainabacteria bacterium]|nr:EamA family transporter [Candidatus Melainabacteria bacterium]